MSKELVAATTAPGRVADDPIEDPFRAIVGGYMSSLSVLLERLDVDALLRIVGRLRTVRDAGGMVYIAGNGGSAATASHWANDLGKATRRSEPATRSGSCASPTTSRGSPRSPTTRATSGCSPGQLENFAAPGRRARRDLGERQLAEPRSRLSSSRRARGMTTIALLGFDGGQLLKELVDEALWVTTEPGAVRPGRDGALRALRHRHDLPHRGPCRRRAAVEPDDRASHATGPPARP